MPVNKFKFISPSVKIAEIDNSQIPATPGELGTVVIGRAQRGPAMKPVKVSSFAEFVDIFGEPSPQNSVNDVWRDNQILGPIYGAYAAQAVLKASTSLTYVRLLGAKHPEATTDSGEAGWKVGTINAAAPTGGAYGLFVFPSGSVQCTGTLAAIWYIKTGSIALEGTLLGTTTNYTGCAGMLESNSDREFKIMIRDNNGVTVESTRFNFTPSSDKFIRKVFNTNPTAVNTSIYAVSDVKKYFLGETFEDFINSAPECDQLRVATKWNGVVLALQLSGGTYEHSDRRIDNQNSQTGWFFSQDFSTGDAVASFNPTNMPKLFKFHSLDSGEWNQSNIKISIRNIRISDNTEVTPYGSFDVVVRKIDDTDAYPKIVEQFIGCNLNPNDPENYIGAKIGDKYTSFNTTTLLNDEFGMFENRSRYIRVEVSDKVANKTVIPQSLPFGVFGPVQYKNFSIISGSTNFKAYSTATMSPNLTAETPFVKGANQTYNPIQLDPTIKFGVFMIPNGVGWGNFSGSVVYPKVQLRADTRSGSLSYPGQAYFGVYTDDSSGRFARSTKDIVRAKPANIDSFTPSDSNGTQYSWIFTLDDIKYMDGSTTEAQWISGARATSVGINNNGSYQAVLDAGFNNFTTVLAGGFDGFDITEIEPFRNTALDSVTEKTSYEFNTLKRAIDIITDPEDVEYNLAAIPGITNTSITNRLIAVCEDRGDAMAIIDCSSDFQPRGESSNSLAARTYSVDTTADAMKARALNTSYAAAYSSWVNVRDSINNALVPVPPSVIALGTLAYNDAVAAPYYAPAGFSRGNVSNGNAGLNVVSLVKKLRQSDRDKLYDAKINAISNVSNAGIVVWGQKTLLSTNSALNRINVRRAMLYLEKTISKIALQVVFDANASVTWNRFVSLADPILQNVLSDNGIQEYKLVFNQKTNTPDNIDNNIAYGKIFVKPTKAIEFIGLDFNITPQGASFSELT